MYFISVLLYGAELEPRLRVPEIRL